MEPAKKDRKKSSFSDVPIERVRAFWDARPCNVRHSLLEKGTRDYFDEVEKRKYFVEPHIPGFAEFPRWKGKTVLEIGCGIGTDTINFAREGAEVTAVDISPNSLDLARQRAKVFGLEERIRFYEADCEQLDRIVPVTSYDLVYSFGVIHHTPEPERAIDQVKKYMDRYSEFRLMVYSKVSYKLFWIMRTENLWDMSRIDELIARNSEAQTGCPVTHTYTFDELRRLLKGFQISDICKAHIFTWEVGHYQRYEFEKEPAWVNVSDVELREMEKELGWHTLVHARLGR